ncbi:NAD(P)H-dependent oxidoreductase [Siphonobacter sp. SORGH_AS_1065]|uniref:NAD(P)H-dependent oxidoreductase n=1 Tax=Siphonobacter sp. SORGH_AS_1065 TaxID=3041795 RepID=UPI002781E653|nr:NAD(P)H-dependent oxidoreductase [Siphonobacter sp. SORGH_AS_1065]MDQ1087148.1 putative NADPH-quinone reductase [Siphonobacter sp. SORGH_AS_1065]
MKTLIIVIHPDLTHSVINKRWIEALEKQPEKYTIHKLYDAYPDEKIDVRAEQQRIEQYDKIIFQFPLYWFSSPPLLKKWFDEVLIRGWAYGSKSGYKMAGKRIALAISAGIAEDEFMPTKKYKYTLEELTRPFELTFDYVKADYRSFYAYYGMEHNATKEWVEQSIPGYLSFIETLG